MLRTLLVLPGSRKSLKFFIAINFNKTHALRFFKPEDSYFFMTCTPLSGKFNKTIFSAVLSFHKSQIFKVSLTVSLYPPWLYWNYAYNLFNISLYSPWLYWNYTYSLFNSIPVSLPWLYWNNTYSLFNSIPVSPPWLYWNYTYSLFNSIPVSPLAVMKLHLQSL